MDDEALRISLPLSRAHTHHSRVGCTMYIFYVSFAVADVLCRFYRTTYYVYHLHKIRNTQTKSTIFTFQAIFRPCLLHGAAFSIDCHTIETTVNNGGCVFVCMNVCAIVILSQNSICTLISVRADVGVCICVCVCANYMAKHTAISYDIKSKAANIRKIASRGKTECMHGCERIQMK